MSFRVALYAEGPGEDFAASDDWLSVLSESEPPPPGVELQQELLGPTHVLIRRIVADCGLPEGSVRFVSPLRYQGRVARGSDLLQPVMLSQLLAWPPRNGRPRPDMSVLLVDMDEEPHRVSALETFVRDSYLAVPCVVGVAKQEFESWLLADHEALVKALDVERSKAYQPEDMPRRRAKETLSRLIAERIAEHTNPPNVSEFRRDLARVCKLDVVARVCSESFGPFREALGRRVASIMEAQQG